MLAYVTRPLKSYTKDLVPKQGISHTDLRLFHYGGLSVKTIIRGSVLPDCK